MPSTKLVTLFRRDVLFAVLALLLLFAPVWVSVSNISETTYTYERAEVVVTDTNGITYAGDPPLDDTHISTDIGCSVPQDIRACAFERYLISNASIPTKTYTNNPAAPFDVGISRYEYVQVNGTVYDPGYVGNRSAQRTDGLYRLDLALEPTSATDALDHVAIDLSTEADDMPHVVVEAATQGTATADQEVEVPQTPLRVEENTYYRVYIAGHHDPIPAMWFLGIILSIFGPVAGLYIGYRLSHRFELRYRGETEK